MENRSQKMLQNLVKYYENESNIKKILNVILSVENSSNVSLRLIDWLVTNYSKSNKILYVVNGRPFNIYQNYKDMLKAYSKRLFDPFRRHERIYIPCKALSNGEFETTVAQLTFFKWAIENKVIDYAHVHKNEIKKHMDDNISRRKFVRIKQ